MAIELWHIVHDVIQQQVRIAAGKKPMLAAAVTDGQTVKTTELDDREHGYDAGKT